MEQNIHQRLDRIYRALGKVDSQDLSIIRPEILETGYRVDFGIDEIEAENYAHSLIHNIASLKDHLKEWCKINSMPFKGEELINSNKSVAIVHDLWNIDKHKKLSSEPRSGCTPQIKDLNRSLEMTATMGSGIFFDVDRQNAQVRTHSEGQGFTKSALVIDGKIIDENNQGLGSFLDICNKAIIGWEELIASYGLIKLEQENNKADNVAVVRYYDTSFKKG